MPLPHRLGRSGPETPIGVASQESGLLQKGPQLSNVGARSARTDLSPKRASVSLSPSRPRLRCRTEDALRGLLETR